MGKVTKMSSNNENISAMADMVLAVLDTPADDDNTKIQVCNQVITFFREILDNITEKTNVSKLKSACQKYWKFLLTLPDAFNNTPDETPMISQFFIEFLPLTGKVKAT